MPDKTSTQICPTCGTRISAEATRCLVCGAELSTEKPDKAAKGVQGSRIPTITLSLPVVILLLALFLALGAVMVYAAVRTAGTPRELIIPSTDTTTPTLTVTPTTTPTGTPVPPTDTPQPTPTPLSYKVAAGDSCSSIAAYFKVSINSIILLNDLSTQCILSAGDELLIPQPTPTATSLPTATPGPATQTAEACGKVEYEVQPGDTLGAIARNYNISSAAIKKWNGLTGDMVFEGTTLMIPLCELPPTAGPTPTLTPPPPYAAPNLLLPANGAPFSLADESIVLQWASVGALRQNEAYMVTIRDETDGKSLPIVDYVTDTKYILPSTYRPKDTVAHIFSWTVTAMRQTGSDSDGRPIYESAGASSAGRVFSWSGTGGEVTATP